MSGLPNTIVEMTIGDVYDTHLDYLDLKSRLANTALSLDIQLMTGAGFGSLLGALQHASSSNASAAAKKAQFFLLDGDALVEDKAAIEKILAAQPKTLVGIGVFQHADSIRTKTMEWLEKLAATGKIFLVRPDMDNLELRNAFVAGIAAHQKRLDEPAASEANS